MGKIAIDLALLPPQKIAEEAIGVNRRLIQRFGDGIELNRKTCLPHITLVMGLVEKRDLLHVEKIAKEIVGEFRELDLGIVELYSHRIGGGKKISGYKVKRTRAIQALHEALMKRLESYLSYRPSPGMFFSPPRVQPVTLGFLRDFLKRSHEDYCPHITLGLGETKDFKLRMPFTASRLAICHLGNFCTCRKVLAHFRLETAASKAFL